MNKAQNTFLTPSQFTFTIVSLFIGSDFLNLPNTIIKAAKQDSWLSCIMGALYPIYMIIISNYLCKKYPKENIIKLSKKCFGNFFGSILNFIFISFFLFVVTSELSGFSFVFRAYATPFLKNYQVFLVALIPITYICYKGIKPLGRLNEVGFWLTIPLIFLLLPALKDGNLSNLMPIFGSGLTNIAIGSKATAYTYCGMEMLVLIYPFLKDKGKLFKCSITGLAIVVSVYTFIVFLTIFYLGVETSPTYIWPVLSLADSIHIPMINSFRFIFITIWSFMAFKCTATFYFAVSYGLNQSIRKISAETFTLLLYPLIIFISSLYKNQTIRESYTSNLIPIYIIFNLIFISTVAILIHFKKGAKNEKI